MLKRIVSGIMLTLLLVGMLTLTFNVQPVRSEPRTWTVDDDGPADFHTIQEAINHANEGDTVFVRNGIYYENVAINKTILLIGANRSATIIDGNGTGNCVKIKSDDVVFRDFTVRNGHFVDVRVYENISRVLIKDNIILNSDWGIYLSLCSNNTVEGNLVKNCSYGVFVESSSYNLIVNNTVVGNHYGIVLKTILHIPEFPPPPSSNFNRVYHNNFINNDFQAFDQGFGNTWDDGYPSGGNYWSDYNGTDTTTPPDGIGDTYLPWQEVDYYPLMNPYSYWNPADINYDLKVDIRDVSIVARAFGSYPGHPRWNPIADLIEDDKVNVRDLAFVCRNFGKTCL